MIYNNVSINTLATIQATANAAMPKSGGTFTGDVSGLNQNLSGAAYRNIAVADSSGTWQTTGYILMMRQ